MTKSYPFIVLSLIVALIFLTGGYYWRSLVFVLLGLSFYIYDIRK